jgi:hypothetical protein
MQTGTRPDYFDRFFIRFQTNRWSLTSSHAGLHPALSLNSGKRSLSLTEVGQPPARPAVEPLVQVSSETSIEQPLSETSSSRRSGSVEGHVFTDLTNEKRTCASHQQSQQDPLSVILI